MKTKSFMARLMAAPHVLWSILFILAPLAFVFYYAFTDKNGAFTLSNIKEVKAREAVVIGIGLQGDKELQHYADHVIFIPETEELLAPLLAVVPLQLLAYYSAVARNCDVDKPRNLAKSVTVE